MKPITCIPIRLYKRAKLSILQHKIALVAAQVALAKEKPIPPARQVEFSF